MITGFILPDSYSWGDLKGDKGLAIHMESVLLVRNPKWNESRHLFTCSITPIQKSLLGNIMEKILVSDSYLHGYK